MRRARSTRSSSSTPPRRSYARRTASGSSRRRRRSITSANRRSPRPESLLLIVGVWSSEIGIADSATGSLRAVPDSASWIAARSSGERCVVRCQSLYRFRVGPGLGATVDRGERPVRRRARRGTRRRTTGARPSLRTRRSARARSGTVRSEPMACCSACVATTPSIRRSTASTRFKAARDRGEDVSFVAFAAQDRIVAT